MKYLKLIIGVILTASGLIFSLLPHEVHESITFGINLPHWFHDVIGLATGLIGLILLFLWWKNHEK